jgi:CelD/BcsL family acetyltransferase involved in cellulose biosynthesis
MADAQRRTPERGGRNMKLQRYSSFEAAAALQPAWDRLVEETGGDVFTSFDWCAVWWRHYGSRRRLQLFVAFEGDEVVGVLPLFSETLWGGPVPVRVVRLAGCDHSVTTCGVAIRPEHAREMVQGVVDGLTKSVRWDVIQLGPLPTYDVQAPGLLEAFKVASGVASAEIDTKRHGEQMLIDLPAQFEEYVKALPRNERRAVLRRTRRIGEQHEIQTVVSGTNGDVEDAFDRMVALHQRQWTSLGHLGHFKDWPAATEFHKDMLAAQSRHGRCFFVELRCGDALLAMQYAYHFGPRLHALLTARSLDEQWNAFAPGKLMHMAVVENAIGRRCTILDDMRGRYEYKRRLGGGIAPLRSVMAYRGGPLRRARLEMFRAVAWCVDVMYNKIWFTRLATRARLKKRPLWTWWIRSKV